MHAAIRLTADAAPGRERAGTTGRCQLEAAAGSNRVGWVPGGVVTEVCRRRSSTQEGRFAMRDAGPTRPPQEEQFMGYQARERKRKQRIAVARNQRAARRSGSSAEKWWLTVVSKDTCCARCGRILRR